MTMEFPQKPAASWGIPDAGTDIADCLGRAN
jgi:hypothetical protein